MKLLLLLCLTLFAADAPKPPPVVFSEVKPACNLIDGKLVLAKSWPFGNWEACAYSILQVASQLAGQRDALVKEIEAIKSHKK